MRPEIVKLVASLTDLTPSGIMPRRATMTEATIPIAIITSAKVNPWEAERIFEVFMGKKLIFVFTYEIQGAYSRKKLPDFSPS
jgi:hypothetical protein